QVLLCSEIGSEGRNFQFAHNLVMFDLPLNPDLLEQRIGRLDRIGQTREVKIHVPFYPDTAQEKLLAWYHQGLNAFEKTCAIGQTAVDRFEAALRRAMTHTAEGDFAEILMQTKKFTAELIAELQQGRDRLLELNSCKPEQAAHLIQALTEKDDDPHLAN